MTAHPESRVFNVLAASLTRRAGGLDLLVRTEVAACTLHFSANLADGLLVAPPIPGQYRVKRTGKRHLNSIKPERRARYVAIYVAWKTEPNLSQRAACERHGVAPANFQAWAYNHREELDAELAAHRAALPKPNGKLL